MQFVKDGPDVPEVLLQAHEEGRVVFFCGAGISYPAGLPGFKGLVDRVYQNLLIQREPDEKEAYKHKQYEVTLGLLERRLPGQRLAVRKVVKDILQTEIGHENKANTHEALLQLGQTRDGKLRLVTSNFDRIFENIADRSDKKFKSFIAPMLPVPKNSRWDGLVYLHGLLPKNEDNDAINKLVITSGDFGLAYLAERWAARFVSELFRDYIVCFVGYSISDYVLRYMMDALAADRMLGENNLPVYAFGSYKRGKENEEARNWRAKGVEPILYKNSKTHSKLHLTIQKWSELYRDGISGKESIVVKYAQARPSKTTQQDGFKGQMLWALSDKSGLPAKRFAELDPTPSLEWLEIFSEGRYRYHDLERFAIQPNLEADEKLTFSLIYRPAPYMYTPWMSLISFKDIQENKWDAVMYYLACWLLKYLNDPILILWLVKHGDVLHSRFHQMIENKLAQLERENKDDVPHTNAHTIMLHPFMRVLWRLVLTGRVKSSKNNLDFYRWKDRLGRDGLTATIRFELRELLAPKVVLRKPVRWFSSEENVNTPDNLRQFVDYDLVLTADYISMNEFEKIDTWRGSLPILLDDFQQLLRDALDLFAELGDADEHYDQSYLALPSITPHWQNRSSRDWAVLIELLRDAWLAVCKHDLARSQRIAQEWVSLPYLTFKRLALFAASQDKCIAGTQWVNWLTIDDAYLLWSPYSQRETMRLLVKQSEFLSQNDRTRLEDAILMGPPRTMYKNDLEPERWHFIVDRGVWLRLLKLQEGGIHLGASALQRFENLSTTYPTLQLSKTEREEFSHWTTGTGAPDFESERASVIVPREREKILDWLTKTQKDTSDSFSIDAWRKFSRKYPIKAGRALRKLAFDGKWLSEFWNTALYTWSERKHTKRLWKFLIPFVSSICDDISDDNLKNIVGSVTRWMETISKLIGDDEKDILFKMCHRILKLQYQEAVDDGHPISQAINHPVGHVTEVLLNLWFQGKPNDNEKLSEEIKVYFTLLCDTKVEWFRHGRVLLASQLIALFRVDPCWSKTYLLPLFDWNICHLEAIRVWEGFLWSPRLYEPLLIELKTSFFNTANHYEDLSETKHLFTAFLTYAALEPIDAYTEQDFRKAIAVLPQDALQQIIHTLIDALEATEQREEFWENRICPFWNNIWPKHISRMSPEIARLLAELSIAARREFPSAVSMFKDWFQPVDMLYGIVKKLYDSDLVRCFPEDSLNFLSATVNVEPWVPLELKKCLDIIVQTKPELKSEPKYQRLADHCRQGRL